VQLPQLVADYRKGQAEKKSGTPLLVAWDETRNRLRIPQKTMLHLFSQVIDPLLKCVQSVVDKHDFSVIVAVGGFFKCKLLL
jgi:hypothetical protein